MAVIKIIGHPFVKGALAVISGCFCSADSDSGSDSDSDSYSGYSLLFPPISICGHTANIACPKNQDLSFALNKRLAKSPAIIAAVIPPAVPFSPPVNIPRKPASRTLSFTLFARV